MAARVLVLLVAVAALLGAVRAENCALHTTCGSCTNDLDCFWCTQNADPSNKTTKFCFDFMNDDGLSCADETSVCLGNIGKSLVWIPITVVVVVLCCTVVLPLCIAGIVALVFFGGVAAMISALSSSDGCSTEGRVISRGSDQEPLYSTTPFSPPPYEPPVYAGTYAAPAPPAGMAPTSGFTTYAGGV